MLEKLRYKLAITVQSQHLSKLGLTKVTQSTPDQSKVPFMIAPPISRVEATKSQTLRITALPNASQLNQKQETVLWLNILDIPQDLLQK